MAWSIFTDGGGNQVAVGWAKQLLAMLGAPDTPGNEEFIYQWEKSEGGGGKYNPLNQGPVAGKPYLTTTGEQFGGGAADFASWQAGLQGAYDYLHYNYYKGVLAGLMNNDPVAARSALWASPWASSHYGFGSNWAFVGLPGGTPVLPTTVPQGEGRATGQGGSDATLTAANAPDTCAWNLGAPSISSPDHIGPIPLPNVQIGGASFCLVSKTQVRAFLGGVYMAGALFAGAVGLVLLGAFAFRGIAGSIQGKNNPNVVIRQVQKAQKASTQTRESGSGEG